MKVWLSSIITLCMLAISQLASAQTVIYQDDFEGTVSGWTVNDIDFDNDVTNFLGRFSNSPTTTSRTFTVPAGSTQLDIDFDLYRFDSWDTHAGDGFELDINGTTIFFTFDAATGSGSSGNINWSYTRTRGPEQFAFNMGIEPWWREQLFNFDITINNPGTNVTLTLRANLNQDEGDESIGYDNFLVTVPGTEITAVAENFTTIDGTSGGVTTSVLASDTLDNQPVNPNDVTLTVINSSSPNVVLDPATGLITVAAGTSSGFYTVEYEICENANPLNCSSVTEMITVSSSTPGGGGGFCPVGTAAVPGTYHVVSATDHPFQNQNAVRTVGQPLAEGAIATDNNTALTFFGAITMDLTGDPNILAPEGSVIEIVLSSHYDPNDRAEILMSADGVSYTSLGTTGDGGSVHGAWPGQNILRYDDFTVPPGGARFVQVLKEDGGIRADGVIYDTQCQPAVTAPVIVAADDSETVPSLLSAQTNVLNVIDNDTFDGNLPTSFDLAINTSSSLPPELTFDTVTGDVGVVAGTVPGVYSFDYDICEAGTTNCATATVTITVELAVIDAIDDDYTAASIDPTAGGATASIFANDTLDGAAFATTDVTTTVTDDGRLIGVVINPDGTITVPAGTAPGTYEVDYEICDVVNPTNCDTAVATIAVVGSVNSIANPTVCGAWNSQGWLTYGSPAGHNAVDFNSGNYANDPYVYTPMTRDANGRIVTYFGAPVTTSSGVNPDRASTPLIAGSQNDADHQSELQSIVYRLEGIPNTSETITFDTISSAEFTAHWVEDSAGNVQSSQDFINTRVTVAGESFPVTLNYPADGILFLHATIFDPTFGYGRPNLPDYECPAPSMSMTKVASSPGPYTVGDVITYTYTVTNDGDQIIRDVAITDTHNGSDPAPVPGNEILLTDATPGGDSTDAAVDGSWDILAPGDVITFTGTYTVTQIDAENL